MDRIVRDLTSARRSEETRPRYFSEYLARANIVLLGDPGAGKSHLLRTSAALQGGRYVTVRNFLAVPVRTRGESLFIDALDEKRAGRGDRDTVDALVGKLFDAAPAKVRLSCRAADWLGESDLASLRPFFDQNGGEPAVLGLERLSPDERRAVIIAQGLNAAEADAFLEDAENRGLGDFLDNPQNLLMLLRTVRSGQWPETRTALFELSTALMLQEADAEHARQRVGVHSVAELRLIAGAIFAARLISDVEGISLLDQEGTATLPSHRSLSFLNRDLVRAALTRRVFVTGSALESVDYAHRTTAEYLGAAWLADAVRAGLPFGRLQALMGVDGHPAPELRGLHAWLAVHLPEHAERMIDADPYGVLTYGDAASLPHRQCVHLMRALGRLSQEDPWFRSGQWEAPAIGALSRPDMVDEFQSVLSNANAGFSLRSIVLQALATGMPLPALKDGLATILRGAAFPYSERELAIAALVRLGAAGKAIVVDVYRSGLGSSEDGLRLRADIFESLYGEPFGPDDLVRLLEDTLASEEELVGGAFWNLVEQVPPADLAIVLDRIAPGLAYRDSERRNRFEVSSFYERALLRVWTALDSISPARAWGWLARRHGSVDSYSGWRDELRAALRASPERLGAITDHVLETFEVDDDRWLKLSRLREFTAFVLDAEDVLARLMEHRARAEPGSERELFFYEAGFGFAYASTPEVGQEAFDALHALAEDRTDLLPVRARSVTYDLPANYYDHRLRRREREEARDPDAHRRDFERDAELVRTGAHAGWLACLAQVYFARFSDVDAKAEPNARLAAFIGTANVGTALQGFEASLWRPDIPSLDTVVALGVEGRWYVWWLAILAGLTQRFTASGGLDGVSDELLRAALAIDLSNPVFVTEEENRSRLEHPWKVAVLRTRPELVRDAYAAKVWAKLRQGAQHVEGLRELMTLEELAPFRQDLALELLRDFPNADPYQLDQILDAASALPEAHGEFVALARAALAANGLDAWQRDKWLAAAYMLAPEEFKDTTAARARERPLFIFELRDRTGFGRDGHRTLQLPQLEFLVCLAGSLYAEAGFPRGELNGDRNDWDAARYVHALVDTVSSIPSGAAGQALTRLLADPALGSYRELLLHARANQQKRQRESQYDRPDWPQTLRAFAKGPPATVADLHALLVAHIDDLRTRIARANTDQFKAFWNIDRHARPTEPRPEEACRDTLVDLLRPGLAPLGVMVEPEGHMARDKRADISAAMPARKVLCELKRDYHPDVWSAIEKQLERFYVHDPDAQGFGVYGVFWFGDKRPHQIPPLPDGQPLPNSASELERILRALLPEERRARIAIVVIDASGALPAPAQVNRRTKQRKTVGRKPRAVLK